MSEFSYLLAFGFWLVQECPRVEAWVLVWAFLVPFLKARGYW